MLVIRSMWMTTKRFGIVVRSAVLVLYASLAQ